MDWPAAEPDATTGIEPAPDPFGDDDGDDGVDGDDDGNTFIMEPDGGGSSYECDLYGVNTCGAGRKCAIVWGGTSPVGTVCAQIAPDPAQRNETCFATAVDGATDDCDDGLVCWDQDGEGQGLCVQLCDGPAASPSCPDPNDMCVGKDLALCFPRCYPLDDNCPAGCGCYPVNNELSCAPDASGDMGAYGDECEFLNVCDPGNVCLEASHVPGCGGAVGCCAEFCDLLDPACPDTELGVECVPWFEEDEARPGYENLGACVLTG